MEEKLTIDEIIEHCERRVRFLKRFVNFESDKEYLEHKQVKEYLKELKKYRCLEEQGRLIKLPFKAGDTVYIIQKRYTKCIYGQEFDESVCCGCEAEECDSKNEYTIVPRKMNLNWIVNELNEFGKTVFLTEQEALKALEGMK